MALRGTFVTVPEHEHTGPTDGTECKLCQFYQRGYWTGTDAILDYSRQTYKDGLQHGSTTTRREYQEFAIFLARCIIYGAILGMALRAMTDARNKTKTADTT